MAEIQMAQRVVKEVILAPKYPDFYSHAISIWLIPLQSQINLSYLFVYSVSNP